MYRKVEKKYSEYPFTLYQESAIVNILLHLCSFFYLYLFKECESK